MAQSVTSTSTTMTTGGVNKIVAMVGGAILALVGILGFFNDPILGYFETNLLHNVIHLGSGLVLLGAAFMSGGRAARMTLLVLGVVYALVAVLGFVAPDLTGDLLGDDPATTITLMPDNVLHLLLAIVFIAVPLVVKENVRAPGTMSPRV